MNPFSLQFKETPLGDNLDYSLIEYDEGLNLSVDKKTRQPAINVLSMDTETVTKAQGDYSSDTDINPMSLLDTQTLTLVSLEESDNDRDRMCLKSLMDTSTITESREDIDQDK